MPSRFTRLEHGGGVLLATTRHASASGAMAGESSRLSHRVSPSLSPHTTSPSYCQVACVQPAEGLLILELVGTIVLDLMLMAFEEVVEEAICIVLVDLGKTN